MGEWNELRRLAHDEAHASIVVSDLVDAALARIASLEAAGDQALTAIYALHGDLGPDRDGPWHDHEREWFALERLLPPSARSALEASASSDRHAFLNGKCCCGETEPSSAVPEPTDAGLSSMRSRPRRHRGPVLA